MQILQFLIIPLLSLVVAQQHCDDKVKDALDALRNSTAAAFDKCDPGKKIWDALTDFKAPNFRSCICDENLHHNLTMIRQSQAVCDSNNLHDLAQADALIGQWKAGCQSGTSGTSATSKSGGLRVTIGQGLFFGMAAMTAVAFAL